MAITAFSPAFAPAVERRPSRVAAWVRGILNAIVAYRVRRADAELRRHNVVIHEASLIHGPYRRVRLSEADLLPFNRPTEG
jgi:hypothetical protein